MSTDRSVLNKHHQRYISDTHIGYRPMKIKKIINHIMKRFEFGKFELNSILSELKICQIVTEIS